MWKFLYCLVLLVGDIDATSIGSAEPAQPVSDFAGVSTCTPSVPCGPSIWIGQQIGPFPRGVDGQFYDFFDRQFVLTVISGPQEGLFAPCLVAAADWFNAYGMASATATFQGGAGGAVVPLGRGSNESCGPPGIRRGLYTLGVPLTGEISLMARAGTLKFWDNGYADAFAAFEGFFFYDSLGNPASGVTISVVEVPFPEIPTASSLFSGLLILAFGYGMKYLRPGRSGRRRVLE